MAQSANAMNTNVAKPDKVAIIGASGTYGRGILARAEEISVATVVVTRSPHKFPDVKPTSKRSLPLPIGMSRNTNGPDTDLGRWCFLAGGVVS